MQNKMLFVLPGGAVHLVSHGTRTTIVIDLNGERKEYFHAILFYVPVEVSPRTNQFLECVRNPNLNKYALSCLS